MSMKHVLILGNQLFPPDVSCVAANDRVFMAEDYGLCTHYRYHKHKLIFFLAAMRHYCDELRHEVGAQVDYVELEAGNRELTFEDKLESFITRHSVQELYLYEIEDKFFESRIQECAEQHSVVLKILPSPMFLVSRLQFEKYNQSVKRPFMKTFYESLRKEHKILMDADGKPLGGKYSFDAENRKKLPKELSIPELRFPEKTSHVKHVSLLVDELFRDHPGESESFWIPVTRDDVNTWITHFVEERFHAFGDYEDAISKQSPFLFHSVISPLLNIGLITPKELLERIVSSEQIPLNSLEGFVRQVLGWREFIRGIYQQYSDVQEQRNFWGHSRKLSACWYSASTGMPPLDDALNKVLRYGYNHHIERLMILSNTMLLCNIDPTEVHRWFMEMYVDSSDWVMGPNVYGMGQFSDGGIFATKPYLCGSNYIRKMSRDYPVGDWCDELDGLYWKFIDDHRDFFSKNPRLGTMIGNLNRMAGERKERIFKAGMAFRDRVSTAG